MKRKLLSVGIFLFLIAFISLFFGRHRRVEPENPKSPVVSMPVASSSTVPVPNEVTEEIAEKSFTQLAAGEISPAISPEHAQVDVDGLSPNLILDRRVTDLGNGEVQRLFLVNGGGSYPYHRIEELLRYDTKLNRYILVRQHIIVADHFLVKLRAGVDETELEALNRRFGTRTLAAMGFANKYIIQLPEPSLDSVISVSALFAEEKDIVEHVHVDPIHAPTVIPNDPDWNSLWDKQRIDCPNAWNKETGNTNIIVAVLDTGVDLDHPDLAANIWHNPGEAGVLASNGVDDDSNGFIDDWIGWDFGRNDNNPDDNGDADYDGTSSAGSHGTHCAGIIGAVGNNATDVVGVCWNIRIMALKPFEYFTAYGDMRVYASKAELAMAYATDQGAKLTSNSYGGPGDSTAYYDGIDYQNSAGVLFIAAAGNNAEDNDAVPYQPSGANLPNVIAVASSTSAEALSSFSNYGSNTVDIVAPGSTILSTIPNGLTGSKNGTSMAGPQVAGAAALLYSRTTELPYLNCKQLLLDGVDLFAAYSNKCVSHGRLNIGSSLDLLNGYSIKTPVAGAFWPHQSTQTIQWIAASTTGLSRISIYQDGSNVLTIASNVPTADGVYEWTVADSLPTATNYWIRIEDMANASLFGESGLFTIKPWFPYSESFETGFGEWVNAGSDDGDWTRHSGGTTSSSTGPSGAQDGSYYLYTEASSGQSPGYPNKTALLDIELDFAAISSPELSFYYHMYGAAMGTLYVDVYDGIWHLDVWSKSGQQHTSSADSWSLATVNLSDYGNISDVTLRFRGVTGSSFTSDMAIDHISIHEYVPKLDHFIWRAIPLHQEVDTAFDVEITTRDEAGALFPHFTGTVALSALLNGTGTSSRVVITELDTNPDVVEFMNASASSVDMSGWRIAVYDTRWPVPATVVELPTGAVASSGSMFELHEYGTAPGSYPVFYTGVNIDWVASSKVSVLLLDETGHVVDFMCAAAASPISSITDPTTVPVSEWNGEPISAKTSETVTYQRLGNRDNNSSNDWVIAAENIGVLNPGLTIPFTGDLSSIAITPSNTSSFVAGVWSGNVTVNEVGTNIFLRADDGTGHIDDSSIFSVYPAVLDVDNDGIPDWWETLYFGSPANCVSTNDVDHDGHNNWQEYICGMDPTNASSVFAVSNFDSITGSVYFVIEWPSVSGRVYNALWSTNLMNSFLPLETGIEYPRNSCTDMVHSAEDACFYNVEVQLQ